MRRRSTPGGSFLPTETSATAASIGSGGASWRLSPGRGSPGRSRSERSRVAVRPNVTATPLRPFSRVDAVSRRRGITARARTRVLPTRATIALAIRRRRARLGRLSMRARPDLRSPGSTHRRFRRGDVIVADDGGNRSSCWLLPTAASPLLPRSSASRLRLCGSGVRSARRQAPLLQLATRRQRRHHVRGDRPVSPAHAACAPDLILAEVTSAGRGRRRG